ncbi:stage V sporulation protein AD [Priestia flexa]|uniref:stage V sporulation protein AD n=1 Tax=Priestia flexa TaxID=86664 RepID=UPI000956A085|nr:stage V sporulation protein AD [Priestia flexa]MBY6084996.1 stage V sporulation protein AD [Priestia flexa]QCS52071.1 stage V sporulation protein AD [Priestia flexa]WEZ09706.1 stage V sporulation protein AD [Priestia flexa]SIP88647.1 stage V sporulation protein AD [Priestia flexa]
MRKAGKQTWVYENLVYINAAGTAVGPKEADGPLGSTFDITHKDLHCEEANWELAERKLMRESIDSCLGKMNLSYEDVDLFLAGDLLNQNVTANFVARDHQIPFLCMFGACSTSMETLATGAALVDAGFANRIIASASSHNATAERQFRYPTEYGGQKPDTATATITGAGSALVSRQKSPVRLTSATVGRVMDYGIKNPFDMGSAMAPAAADTIQKHFEDLQVSPDHYDLIVTGDLSGVGSPILKQLLKDEGYDVSENHNDCGLMVYRPNQNVFAGGSGCGCSAVVTYGHLLNELKSGNLKRIFVVATGALLSPTMTQQKESIPTIAHGVVMEHVEEG